MSEFELLPEECIHATEDRESEMNEEECWAICTRCGKDFSTSFQEEMADRYPDEETSYRQQLESL